MQVADAFVRYLADTKDLTKAVGPGGAVAAAGTQGAATVGQRFSTAFQKVGQAGSVAGGVFFATALEGATKLDDQLRTINTVAGLSDSELGKLGDSVQALSRETGKSTDDLTAGLYDLVSAGVPAGDAINVLRDSAKLAVGALGTTGEAVDAVTSALNAYELGATESTRVSDIFAKAVADGKVTISEIGSSIANIAPIAASAGVSLEEVSAGYAMLTAKGVPAAQAATQMRAAISALLTPNQQLLELQEKTGVAFADVAREKGLAVALEELRVATGGNSEMFAKSLGSIDAYQFALASTGDNAEGFAGQITETMGAAGIAQEQYAEKSKSASEQGKRLFATLSTFAQDVGGPFVGSLGAGAFALNEMGRAFGLPISPAKLLGGAIGGIFTKAIPALTAGIGGLLPAIAPALTGLVGGLGTVLTAALAAWPLLLLAAVVAAIIFLVNNPEIVAKIGEVVGGILDAVMTFMGALPGILVDVFTFAIGKVVEIILALPGLIVDLLPRLIGFFTSIHLRLIGIVADLVRGVVGFVLSIPGKIAGLVPGMVAHVRRVATEFLANVSRLAGGVVSTILGIPGRVAAWVTTIIGQVTRFAGQFGAKIASLVGSVVSFFLSIPGKIASLGGKIVSGIINGMASLPGKLVDTIARAFRSIKIDIGPFHISASGIRIDLPEIKLPSFDVGSSFVPADMLAMVHKGEIIIPADEAEAIRSGRTTLGRPGGGNSTAPPALPSLGDRGGGDTYIIDVDVDGLIEAATPDDIVRPLRSLANTGYLSRPTRRTTKRAGAVGRA